MKKAGMIICFILIFIIIYLLQANLFAWFNLAGVKPNLFVILVLTIGLFAGKIIGITFGVIFGFILDLLIGKSVGISITMLGITGFIGGYLSKNFSKDSRITMITMIATTTLIYESGIILLNFLINQTQIGFWYVIKNLLIEVIYNSIITIIIYPLIIKFGYIVEDTFNKNNKMLTRYF